MVADKIDMSLDEIISSSKKGRGGGYRGRGRGGRGRGRGSFGNNRGSGSGPIRSNSRGRGGSRPTPYSRPRNIPDKWEHDMFDGAGRRSSAGNTNRRSGTGLTSSSAAGVHLQISNLDYGVTDSDIRELFSEFGRLRKATINYDGSGRSHGTADVIFERKADAVKAYKTYNGVPLDGRAMKIESVAANLSESSASNLGRRDFRGGSSGKFQSGSSFRGNNSYGKPRGTTRGRGRGGRGRGRGGQRKPVSKDDLDKELDSYIEKGDS